VPFENLYFMGHLSGRRTGLVNRPDYSASSQFIHSFLLEAATKPMEIHGEFHGVRLIDLGENFYP